MTHPVHATGPDKRACTALTKYSAQRALQFAINSWRHGTRQRPKTITNTSKRLNTPEQRSRVYSIMGESAIPPARIEPLAYSSHPAPARCIATSSPPIRKRPSTVTYGANRTMPPEASSDEDT
jgi:hypothetical protein